jgi:hypothetical protein
VPDARAARLRGDDLVDRAGLGLSEQAGELSFGAERNRDTHHDVETDLSRLLEAADRSGRDPYGLCQIWLTKRASNSQLAYSRANDATDLARRI